MIVMFVVLKYIEDQGQLCCSPESTAVITTSLHLIIN